MNQEVFILDTEIEVPNLNYISKVDEVAQKSLLSIMYPLKDNLNEKLLKHANENECFIYYPWS